MDYNELEYYEVTELVRIKKKLVWNEIREK